MENIIELGRRVQITDPCYEPHDWDKCVKDYGDAAINVLPGKYVCKQVVGEEGQCNYVCELFAGQEEQCNYDRNFRFEVRHQDYPDVQANELFITLFVCSGQCGVFDDEYYRKNYLDNNERNPQSWYHKVSSLTVAKPHWGTLDGKCVNLRACSANGDFKIYVGRNQDGKVVSIRIDLTAVF